MLTINELLSTSPDIIETPKRISTKKIYHQHKSDSDINIMSVSKIDNILENEKQKNKKESWNKLDKTQKIKKLLSFSNKYCEENKSDLYNVETLMFFFKKSLENNKLQKKKDLIYDKDTNEILEIPSLTYDSGNFSLRNMDNKRISTLKSLTPKRST